MKVTYVLENYTTVVQYKLVNEEKKKSERSIYPINHCYAIALFSF